MELFMVPIPDSKKVSELLVISKRMVGSVLDGLAKVSAKGLVKVGVIEGRDVLWLMMTLALFPLCSHSTE